MHACFRQHFVLFAFLATAGFCVHAQNLAGSSDGLYLFPESGKPQKILDKQEVRKIVKTANGWYFLGSRGIVFSHNLSTFEERNNGLPVKTLKTFKNGQKSFVKEIQELKDLETDPYNPLGLVTCTKDNVYVSQDGGLSWKSYPSPAPQPGIKAVAISSKPELTIFASHSIKGPFVKTGTDPWKEIGGELGKSDPGTSADEISDIVIEAGPEGPLVWAANSFLPRLYSYEFKTRTFKLAWSESTDFSPQDSLQPVPGGILFVSEGEVKKLDMNTGKVSLAKTETQKVKQLAAAIKTQLLCINISGSRASPQLTPDFALLNLSELWMLSFVNEKPFRAYADARHGIYLQTGFMIRPETRRQYNELLTNKNLETIVVDLKDDFGRLRYESKDPLVKSMARSVNPLDVEGFVKEMKSAGRYLIARIVVFKDQRLFEYDDGKYAVWDKKEAAPWRGYEIIQTEEPVPVPEGAPPSKAAPLMQKLSKRNYYGEYWVDPYSEKVWEYNVAIAKEIIALGFDEIQFDYIRFPTDGINLDDAYYRWKDPDMDMESGLMSFLSFARENIKAPISIDIYGANGWYRSGVRTGQDVELLSRYVDVICPMFYPSHFEQSFMAFEPAVQRPYRIYKLGTLRNFYIARKKTLVRPYVQAFFLNVKYDREYYNPYYVTLQVEGIRDSVNQGLLFWNNSGRYEDIPFVPRSSDRKISARYQSLPNTFLD